ncbi:MAG: methyltransferase [Bacteroidales bacterium]|nr:methyltransferase [Bacteroidales bacterium]
MSAFRFKRFSVNNDRAAMKVGTDTVLLGAAVSLQEPDRCVLDAGTGTGTVALMLAQRYSDMGCTPDITGIDIDIPSAEEARDNFASSPWSRNLRAEATALQKYRPAGPIDLVVSNPPYFDSSLQAPDERRNIARHAVENSMAWRDLITFAADHLSDNGRLAVILPSDQEKAMLRCARSFGLYPVRITRFRTTSRKAPARFVAEFSRLRSETEEVLVTIQHEGEYTPEYISLVKDFYLNV